MTTLQDKRIAFIGAGNMAEALVQGIIGAEVCPAAAIRVSDPSTERLEQLRTLGVAGDDDNAAAVADADVVLLAVKPQVVDDVLTALAPDWPAAALLISICAGVPTGRIEALLGGKARVVRSMPNTPALLRAGAAAICPGAHTEPADMDVAETILGAAGVVVRVAEADIDAVTAVSGSGPAYVFYLAEAMLKTAAELGLDAEAAQLLVSQTIVGAGKMIRDSGVPAATLRERVTSKGGTTAAALAVLNAEGVGDAVAAAVRAAHKRSLELSE